MLKKLIFVSITLILVSLAINILLDMLWLDFKAEQSYFIEVILKSITFSLGFLLLIHFKIKMGDGRMF